MEQPPSAHIGQLVDVGTSNPGPASGNPVAPPVTPAKNLQAAATSLEPFAGCPVSSGSVLLPPAENPHAGDLQANTLPDLHDIQLSELLPQPKVHPQHNPASDMQYSQADIPTQSSDGLSAGGNPPCDQSSDVSLCTGSKDFFSQVFSSSSLIPVSTVVSVFGSKMKGKGIDSSNVGRFGVLLARCSFFGDDVLQVSTLKGKGNRRGLDPHKLESLLSEIHKRAFSEMSRDEFSYKIQPKVERALRDYLKPSGSISRKTM